MYHGKFTQFKNYLSWMLLHVSTHEYHMIQIYSDINGELTKYLCESARCRIALLDHHFYFLVLHFITKLVRNLITILYLVIVCQLSVKSLPGLTFYNDVEKLVTLYFIAHNQTHILPPQHSYGCCTVFF